MKTAWGRSLSMIVTVEKDGTLVLACGHRKKGGPVRWGRRSSCLECEPEAKRPAWPKASEGVTE